MSRSANLFFDWRDGNTSPDRVRRSYRKALLRTAFCTVFPTLLFWQTSAFGETPDPTLVVEAALQNLDATDLDEDWAFTMALVEEQELRIIRSDPHRDKYQRRQLLTVNGVVPDDRRQTVFRDTEIKRIDELDPGTAGYRYMVDSESLQLIELGDGYAKLSFLPRIKTLGKSRTEMQGLVLLNTATQQIEEIEIHNTAKFSPAFSVTLDTYRLVLRFQQEQGENLLYKLTSHAVGKVAFVKTFDATVDVTFSDFQRADR